MSEQITDTILMVRPSNFGFNEETAANNAFQTNDTSVAADNIKQAAIAEFDHFVQLLRDRGVQVIVAEDSPTPVKPDAIFPNNWITFHEDGTIVTYPMNAKVRRLERQDSIIEQVAHTHQILTRHHLEQFENENLFLEGTGSMIIDRANKIVYACIGPRTDEGLLDQFCNLYEYDAVTFRAVDGNGQDIYHTNVLMAVGLDFVVICLDTIRDMEERNFVIETIESTDKEIIEIALEQMMQFAGNMLQVKSKDGETFLVMSEQAFNSLDEDQVTQIESFTQPLPIPLYTIEKYGGGSARCMMAEVFLPSL